MQYKVIKEISHQQTITILIGYKIQFLISETDLLRKMIEIIPGWNSVVSALALTDR